MKSIYFDCYSGISGDMTLGALIDAGADLAAIQTALASLKVPGFKVDAEKVVKKGISATQFRVIEDEHEHHPHRHLRHVVEIIESGDLPQSVKDSAIAVFRIIGEAEAAVHGTTIEKVHFHEVGAVDSIVDIVGAQYALHLLGIEQAFSSPLHVGAGTVKCAHGIMPVPAPATALILKGVPTYGGAVDGELVTPTGAAIARYNAKSFGPAPLMAVSDIGYGSGTKDLPDRANVLRVLIGEVASDAGAQQNVSVVEATIDDMSGEFWPPLMHAALEAGARDVIVYPVIGKKGRPAHVLSVLCDPEQEGTIARLILAHSTSFGVRIRQEKRVILDRAFQTVNTPWGTVAVKTGSLDGETHTMAPEFEACRKLAEGAGVAVKKVYEAAWAAAIKGEFIDGKP